MSDQQEFPDNTTEYTDVEHSESEHQPHSGGTDLALPEQNLPDKVYIIPIHNRPFFPAQVLPVIVNEEPWAETLELVSKSPHHSLALFFVDTLFYFFDQIWHLALCWSDFDDRIY